jgi:hypothetical protein
MQLNDGGSGRGAGNSMEIGNYILIFNIMEESSSVQRQIKMAFSHVDPTTRAANWNQNFE